jgi:hypothetical protein
MDCLNCKNLERALESRHSEYLEARSSAYYQVTTEFAAHKHVDEERAKSDLKEHQLVCVSAAKKSLVCSSRYPVIANVSGAPLKGFQRHGKGAKRPHQDLLAPELVLAF